MRSPFCRRHDGTPLPESLCKPPGQGLSSATVNVVWGFFNAVVGYLLVAHVGCFPSAAYKPHPRVRPGRAADQHLFGASLRPVPWGQHAVAPVKNSVIRTFRSVFRSLRSFNFRLWTAGVSISNIGTWMQRVAQDWLVLTQLTHHDASALGIVTACSLRRNFCSCPGPDRLRTASISASC